MFALVNVNGINKEVYLGNLCYKSRPLEYAALIGYTRDGRENPFLAGLKARIVYATLGSFESLKNVGGFFFQTWKYVKEKNPTQAMENIGKIALQVLMIAVLYYPVFGKIAILSQPVIGFICPEAMLWIQKHFGLIAEFFEGLNKQLPVFEGEIDGATIKGKKTWENGYMEEGEFNEDGNLVKGKKTWPHGVELDGDFIEGKFVKGTMTWPEGLIQNGSFISREFAREDGAWNKGLGLSSVSGEFKNGQLVKGRKIWIEDCIEDGDFNADGKLVKGTRTLRGVKYKGDFNADGLFFKGEKTWPSGLYAVGEFNKGGELVKGTKTWPDGSYEKRDYDKDGKFVKGTKTWPDGSYEERDYDKDGKFVKGPRKEPDGTIRSFEFIGDRSNNFCDKNTSYFFSISQDS